MEKNEQSVQEGLAYENFLRDLIISYKKHPVLWNKDHPSYKSKEEREEAMHYLVEVTSKYFPDANADFVKTKIESIRGGFRREYKKVLDSKKKAKTDEDIYVPALWYYNHLLFLCGEEYEGDELEEYKDNSRSIYAWTKRHTVTLIDLLKKYPILYRNTLCNSRGNKSKRVKAYSELTNELNADLGSNFGTTEVKLKINTLKQQFRRECKRRTNKELKKLSPLWCYDLLTFLKQPGDIKNNTAELNSSEDDAEETLWDNSDYDDNIDKQEDKIYLVEAQDDIFDTIGKNVAMKLRDMSDDQRLYAENLINNLMYHGMMGQLSDESEISLN